MSGDPACRFVPAGGTEACGRTPARHSMTLGFRNAATGVTSEIKLPICDDCAALLRGRGEEPNGDPNSAQAG